MERGKRIWNEIIQTEMKITATQEVYMQNILIKCTKYIE